MFGVLSCQQDDPFCSNCTAFAKSFEIARQKFLALEKAMRVQEVPDEIRGLCLEISVMLSRINVSKKPVAQKKAGSCRLPKGLCFTRSAIAFYEEIADE